MNLIETLCRIHAPSGNEVQMKAFVLDYIRNNKGGWLTQPEVFEGQGFQDCIVVAFGRPRTAIFAHMDSIGFTIRYNNELLPIGSPVAKTGFEIRGTDDQGPVEGIIKVDKEENIVYCEAGREIQRGTEMVFKCNYHEDEEYIQSCYLDNRLGVYNALKVMETLTDGVVVFSCWEEHGGGSVPYLAKFIYEKWGITQALVSDITWVTEGVFAGEGVAISRRDKGLPRRAFVDKIIGIARESRIPFQVEVEGSGSSDARELQSSPYPFDWCFIGAPEDDPHTPYERVHKADIDSMIRLYGALMKAL